MCNSVSAIARTGDGVRGNLTSDRSRSFDYDFENRLIAVPSGATGSLTYVPLGRLHSYTVGGRSFWREAL